MNSAENLCRKIIDAAEASVEEKKTEARTEIEGILALAGEKAGAIEAAANAEISRRRAAFSEREEAAAAKAIRNGVLVEKARIIDAVLSDAAKALCALDGEPYASFVESLMKGCGKLDNPTVLLQKNRSAQEKLIRARLGDVKIVFDDSVEGGALIRQDDIDYDCRVSTVLARFRAEHEPELQAILFGGAR